MKGRKISIEVGRGGEEDKYRSKEGMKISIEVRRRRRYMIDIENRSNMLTLSIID